MHRRACSTQMCLCTHARMRTRACTRSTRARAYALAYAHAHAYARMSTLTHARARAHAIPAVFACSFVRPPKNVSEPLKDAMKLHVLGVIFHGRADKVHLFPVAPNIAGNANLNCECILRAVQIEFAITGMLPRLHVQVRSAASSVVPSCGYRCLLNEFIFSSSDLHIPVLRSF